MTCKQCVHHEKFHDDAFYCEAMNDLMDETDTDDAEMCHWFKPLYVVDYSFEQMKLLHKHFED